MAIIKTRLVDGHRRVVTKLANGHRRVSCSCCAVPDCCMYPANALMNGLFSENDLPDELNGYIDNNLTIGTYTRSGNGYEATFTGDDGTFLQRVEPQLDGDGSYRWHDGWSSCACLLFCSDIPFTDNFADAYTYTAVFDGVTLESGTLTRQSLCVWSSNISQPLVSGIFYNSDTFRFEQLDANDFNATKTGPSNSPEGEYVVPGDGLYAGGVLTVSL